MFRRRFVTSNRNVPSQGWIGSKLNLSLTGKNYWRQDNFFSPGDRKSDKVSSRIQKAQLASTKLRYLYNLYGIWLSLRIIVYREKLKSLLVYGWRHER